MTTEPITGVRFLQSGGVVGAVRGCEFDCAVMPEDDAQTLAGLVRASGIVESGEYLSPDARDARLYEIHLLLPLRTISVTYDDGTLPETARPLVSFLIATGM